MAVSGQQIAPTLSRWTRFSRRLSKPVSPPEQAADRTARNLPQVVYKLPPNGRGGIWRRADGGRR